MPKEQEIQVKISGRVDSSYNKSISAASQKMSDLNRGTKDVSQGFADAEKSGEQFGAGSVGAVSSLESALAAAGIIALLGETASAFMECTEAAAEYESALAKISTIADTTITPMREIHDEVFALSQETGQSVNDLSESVYQAISASVDTADSVSFVADANKLAVGGFTDTTTAVDVLTTAINAYGLEASAAGEISDMLITTQKLGKTTVAELGQSIGTVIPTAAAYHVNMANISSAMVEMTKQGINTANSSTALRGMLSELAKEGSTVSDTLKEQTGKSFSELMSEGKSLGDVLGILAESVDGDSTAFANLFSNVRARQGALAIFNAGVEEFNGTMDEMANSLGATDEAYSKMENTAEHAQKVFTNSADNLKIAIGESLSPAVTKLYDLGSDILQGITDFVKANPQFVSAIAAVTVGVGIFAAGLVVYTVGAKAAAAATAALTAAMDTNPIFLAITAIVAITAAVVAFVASLDDASKNAEQLTATSQAQKDEIDKLNEKYDETVEKYGETSDKAIELKGKIDELTEQFEASQQTYGEMLSEQAEISDGIAKMLEEDKTKELNRESASAQYLVDKLFALAEQSTITAGTQMEMQSIIAQLNKEYEGLNLTYDDVINKTAQTKESLGNYLDTLYDEQKFENAKKGWIESEELLRQQKEQYQKMVAEANKAAETYGASDGNAQAYAEYQRFWDQTIEYTNSSGEVLKKTFKEAFEEAGNNIDDLEKKKDEYYQTMLEIKGITDEGAQAEISWEEAASQAIQIVQGDLDNLATAYDEAFKSAQKSIESTVGLTTELSNETEITTSKLTETWENQIEWINKYSENLKKAQEYGITDSLIQSLSDGSEESGQYINKIIGELDNLNEADAQALVDKLNEDFEAVKSAEGGFAKTVADYKTDFSDTMDEMQKKAEKAVEGMNLSEEAKKSAKSTIQAYISEITSQINGASFPNATTMVKNAVRNSLTPKGISAYASASPFAIEANAKGTKHSAEVFLAGEEGPELIVNAAGSQVFTAAETQRILSGDVDESGNSYSFDVPELIKQLADEASAERPRFEDMANTLESETNNYDNSSSSVNHISYAPTYQINGGSNADIINGVKEASKMSKAEFAKMMKEYELDKKRVRF